MAALLAFANSIKDAECTLIKRENAQQKWIYWLVFSLGNLRSYLIVPKASGLYPAPHAIHPGVDVIPSQSRRY